MRKTQWWCLQFGAWKALVGWFLSLGMARKGNEINLGCNVWMTWNGEMLQNSQDRDSQWCKYPLYKTGTLRPLRATQPHQTHRWAGTVRNCTRIVIWTPEDRRLRSTAEAVWQELQNTVSPKYDGVISSSWVIVVTFDQWERKWQSHPSSRLERPHTNTGLISQP